MMQRYGGASPLRTADDIDDLALALATPRSRMYVMLDWPANTPVVWAEAPDTRQRVYAASVARFRALDMALMYQRNERLEDAIEVSEVRGEAVTIAFFRSVTVNAARPLDELPIRKIHLTRAGPVWDGVGA